MVFERVRWGIIGCGDVTERKSGPAFGQAEGSELVAVMRRQGELARDYAQRHGVPRWYDNADALIADADVDAVYIATPPGSHCELALRVAAAGKPCYVEKPMARNYSECETMIEAFQSRQLPLFVAYYRRALPRFGQAKSLLDSGRLGEISSVRSHLTRAARQKNGDQTPLPWRLQAEHAGGGLFLDLASHTLDILDWLLGPLQNVAGTASNIAQIADVEDAVSLSFRTLSGAVGAATWNFAASLSEDEIVIDGTRGRLSFSTFGNEPLRLQTEGATKEFEGVNPDPIQGPLVQSMVDELRGRGQCPSTGTSAARTSRVMDVALHDYYGGRDDDFWNRSNWPGQKR